MHYLKVTPFKVLKKEKIQLQVSEYVDLKKDIFLLFFMLVKKAFSYLIQHLMM